MMDTSGVTWRKSSFSGGDNGDCVEVAWPGAVRDSKNPAGKILQVEFDELVSAVKADRITR